jgi:membrane associated rhomboid family serine protease
VSNSEDEETIVRIRRAPKFSVFLIVGGALGVIVALILTSLFPVDPNIGFGPIFGYFAIFGLVGGVLIGAIVALILDRVLSRRTTTAIATIAKLEPEDDSLPPAEAP